jgi:hypothetical protein
MSFTDTSNSLFWGGRMNFFLLSLAIIWRRRLILVFVFSEEILHALGVPFSSNEQAFVKSISSSHRLSAKLMRWIFFKSLIDTLFIPLISFVQLEDLTSSFFTQFSERTDGDSSDSSHSFKEKVFGSFTSNSLGAEILKPPKTPKPQNPENYKNYWLKLPN